MAYKEYTSCVKPSHYVNMGGTAIGFRNIGILLATNGLAAFLIIAFLGAPWKLMLAIALFTSMVIYLYWWLHVRLISLAGETCVVGVITGLGPADPAPTTDGKWGDNDFSMNVLLAPGPTNYTEPKTVYWETDPQGDLVAENDAVFSAGRGYVQDTEPAPAEGHHKYVSSLHSEFEGDGIRNLLIWASVILALLIAALFLPAVLKGLAILLAIIFSLFAAGDAFVPPGAPGAGDPADVDPSLAELKRGDIVIYKGEWIYDSLHRGWNEIHPVRACAIVGYMDLPDLTKPEIAQTPWPSALCGIGLDTTPKVVAFRKKWCDAIEDADHCEEEGSHEDPANDWTIHPLVDGCKPPPIIL
jgi:hypothetical protein